MGAQNSRDFPYDVLEPVASFPAHPVWTMHQGQKRDDKTPVTIFIFDKKKQDKLPLAQNAFKRFKTIRHPNILRYIDGIELETSIYIVTEEVKPLVERLPSIKTQDNALSWGLYTTAKALGFINNDCNLVHGCLSVNSLFVTKAGDWKLGGLDLISDLNDSEAMWKRYNGEVLNAKYKPPELEKGSWEVLQKQPVWSLDAWLFGCLICEVFNGKYSKPEDLKRAGNIPKDLFSVVSQVTAINPKTRTNTLKPLENPYFSNPLVETCVFLENITIKDSFEKEAFFKKLGVLIDQLPQALCKYKILPHLVTALDYGSANAKVLQPVLKIGSMLTPEEYLTLIIPSVIKWFSSTDRALRANLLQSLGSFVEHLSASVIDEQIFPHVAAGFTDPAPALRELTIKATLLLAPKLSEKNLAMHVLKHFNRLQMDPEPGIRTNTTICLGKISGYLPHHVRQKVLIPAFARALRDPFAPARSSGLLALSATHEYYDMEDVALKILPSLSMLTIDPDKSVRDNAFVGIKTFVKKLEQASEQRAQYEARLPANNPASNAANQGSNAPGAASAASAGAGGQGEGWAGWAFNSLTKKIYGEEEQTSPTSPPASQNAQASAPASASSQPRPLQSAPVKKTDGWSDDSSDHRTPPAIKTASRVAADDDWGDANWGDDVGIDTTAPGDSDGWGDFDDDFGESDEKPKKTTPSASKKSVGSPKAQKAKASAWDDFDGGEAEEGDGWGDDDDIDEPPAPKPVAVSKTASPAPKKSVFSDAPARSSSFSSRFGSEDEFEAPPARQLSQKTSPPPSSGLEMGSGGSGDGGDDGWDDFEVDAAAARTVSLGSSKPTSSSSSGGVSKMEQMKLQREERRRKAEEAKKAKAAAKAQKN